MLTAVDHLACSAETYRFLDAVAKHYNIHIEYMFPDGCRGGVVSCRARKVRRMLKGVHAWITEQRNDQSLGTRANIPVIQVDHVFEDVNGLGSLMKRNPVTNVDGKDLHRLSDDALPSGRWDLQSRHRRWKPRMWSRLANKVGKLCDSWCRKPFAQKELELFGDVRRQMWRRFQTQFSMIIWMLDDTPYRIIEP